MIDTTAKQQQVPQPLKQRTYADHKASTAQTTDLPQC